MTDVVIPAGERATENEVSRALVNFLETRAYGEASYKDIR